jgi:ABC-type dipeptide/oligopeptide/nickel transport system permease component
MTSLQPYSSPPRWLSLRLLLGGVVAAALVLLARHHDLSWSTLLALKASASGLWWRCGFSLIVLVTALLLALCTGLIVGLSARSIGARTEAFVAFVGRGLACVPVVVVVWGFIGGWVGHLGWPVESLMPAQFPGTQEGWQTSVARTLWEVLVPALVLALPLSGEMMHGVVEDGLETVNLEFSLCARSVPKGSRLWFHHLRQLLPLLRVRLQSLCLIAPVYLIIIEDALRFMGWGGGLARSLRAGDADGIALGFLSGGFMMALLCACLHLPRGGLKSSQNPVSTLVWQPWLLWALGTMALLPWASLTWVVLWFAVLLSGSTGWYHAWVCIEDQLPAEAARALGASEQGIWREHFAPLQIRMLTAWICAVFAQTLLGIAMACALQPRLIGELNGPLARLFRPLAVSTIQDAAQTLADPAALLQAGGGITVVALCLVQVSRIVQPRIL